MESDVELVYSGIQALCHSRDRCHHQFWDFLTFKLVYSDSQDRCHHQFCKIGGGGMEIYVELVYSGIQALRHF
jgi:hypothetical protein